MQFYQQAGSVQYTICYQAITFRNVTKSHKYCNHLLPLSWHLTKFVSKNVFLSCTLVFVSPLQFIRWSRWRRGDALTVRHSADCTTAPPVFRLCPRKTCDQPACYPPALHVPFALTLCVLLPLLCVRVITLHLLPALRIAPLHSASAGTKDKR